MWQAFAVAVSTSFADVPRQADQSGTPLLRPIALLVYLATSHRLVHLAIRVWVTKKNLATETVVKAIQHVAGAFPSDDYVNRELWSVSIWIDPEPNPAET